MSACNGFDNQFHMQELSASACRPTSTYGAVVIYLSMEFI